MSICNDVKNSLNELTKGKLGNLLVKDWTTLADGEVFYDAERKEYCSVVQLPYESPGENDNIVQQRLNEAVLPGFRSIIRFYNKDSVDPGIARATEWHVPERPNPGTCIIFGLKVLVCIPEQTFNALPSLAETQLRNSQQQNQQPQQQGTVNSPSSTSSIPNEFVKAEKELPVLTSDFEQQLEDIKDLFDVYADTIDKFNGTVQGLDLRREGQKLIQFGNAIKTLFRENGELYRSDEEDLFIIGITNNQIQYILLDKGKELVNLTTKINEFKSNVAVQSDRTINYIFQIDALLSDESEWDEFITKYTLRPPTITPGESKANKEEQKVKSTVSAEETTRIIKVADEKSVKSATEVKKEDTSILDPEVKKTLTLLEETKDAFVGDSVFNDLNQALDDIETLEQAYGSFLNKIGLRSLVQRAIKCLTDQLPLEEIRKALELAKKLAMLKLIPCELFIDLIFNKLNIDLSKIDAFQQAFVNEISGCVNSLTEDGKQALFADVSARSGVPVNTLDELVKIDFNISIEGFGLNTDNIKKAICDKARGAIVDSLPDLDVNLNINFAELGIDINIPDIDLDNLIPDFKPPTISLPDNLPTADIMAAIGEQLEQALIDALTIALVGLIKGLLEDIVNNCGDLSKVDFGVADLEQALADSLGQFRDSEAVRNAKQVLLDSLKFGVDLGNFPEIINSLGDLLNDLSAFLTSAEITLLLNGKPTLSTRQIIACLTDQKYPQLKEAFNNVSKIEQFFQGLGQSLDKNILLQQISSSTIPLRSPIKNICDVPNDESRRRILENKGLTPVQVEEQINNAKNRKLNRLNNLAKLLTNDNVLDNVLPPVFCDKTSAGLIPRDPPSLTFMLDRTIDTVYDGVHMAFNQDISGFVSAITEQASTAETARKVERKKEITLEDGTTTNFRNPEFTRLVSQGVSVENPDDDNGDPITVFEQDPFSVEFGNSFVARGLRQNLQTVETDRTLVHIDKRPNSLEYGKINFIIPSTLSKEIVKKNIPTDLLPINISDLTGALGSAAITEYNLSYYPHIGQPNDAYTLSVLTKNADDSTEILFEFSENNQITSSIKNFLERENLLLLPAKSPQESYFADYVAKSWSRGSNIYVNGIKQPKPDYASGIGNSLTDTNIFGAFRREFLGNQFFELFRDILALITKQSARSPLFRTDVISLIDWTPERVENGCDPHLLDLQTIKKQMKEDYENAACDDSFMPSTDGLGRGQLNPLEQTGVSGVVLTTLRLYVIESLLKAIFFFSEFKISDITQVDNMVSEYITREMKKNLDQLSEGYSKRFFEEALLVHNDLINKMKISGEVTRDSDLAVSILLNEQIKAVMERLSETIGSKGDIDLDNILIEEWLPLFDVPTSTEPRFAEVTQTIGNIKTNLRKNNYKTTFDLTNGNFILERYLRIKDIPNSIYLGNPINNTRSETLFGVVNIERFQQFLSGFPEETLSGEFNQITYGLRLSYVPPVDEFNQRNPIFNNILISADNVEINKNKNKAFDVKEQIALNTGLQERSIAVTPLVSVEIPATLSDLTTKSNLLQKWEEQIDNLRDMLKQTEEYKLLFDFCFPLERILSLGIIYSSVYLSQLDSVRTLFDTTKQSLKSLFETLLNVGNYTYEDGLNPPGANANNLTKSLNNLNNKFNIPGLSLLAIAARTPLLILKGLVEATDSNISNARKIVDGAKDQGAKVPMIAASLAQLPMNIFPPAPFGPGIGPPITPFGLIYLASDIDGIFNSAQGKDVNRQALSPDVNIDFDAQKKKCEE